MANKNDQLVIGYYYNEAGAKAAAEAIKEWDVWDHDVRLGAISILTIDPKSGKLHAKEVGQRSTKSGAGWGTAVGAVAGILTGGLALIPGMALGAAAGGALGSLNHKSVGMSDADNAKMVDKLKHGGAALAVMADDFEVDAVKAKIVEEGGEAENYDMPDETAEAVTMAAAAQAVAADEVDDAPDQVDEEDAAAAAKTVEAVPDVAPEKVAHVSKLAAVTGLSADGIDKLNQDGVDAPSKLLAACATPEGRAELAADTGIDEETLLNGAKRLDLMRVKGVGLKNANLLLASGVDTVPELATRNAENLAKKMAEVNAKQNIIEHSPSADSVADWVGQAKTLPRMIYY